MQGSLAVCCKAKEGIFNVVAMPCSRESAVRLRKLGVEDHPRFLEAWQQRLHLPLVVSRDGAALNCRVEFRVFARVGRDGCEVAFGWESQIKMGGADRAVLRQVLFKVGALIRKGSVKRPGDWGLVLFACFVNSFIYPKGRM